jgi:hypothetical protein
MHNGVIKKNEIMLFVGRWVELENFILSKVSQAKKLEVTCFLSYVGVRPIS